MNDSDLHLNLPAGLVIFGKESLKFVRQPTWEEWQQLMEYLCYCRKTSLRWIADARHEGRRNFGDEAVAQFEEQLELDLRDLKAAKALEAMGVRKAGLSDEYHSLVARRVGQIGVAGDCRARKSTKDSCGSCPRIWRRFVITVIREETQRAAKHSPPCRMLGVRKAKIELTNKTKLVLRPTCAPPAMDSNPMRSPQTS